jgi:hypothetical protein
MKHITLIKSTLAAAALLLSGVHASAQALPSEVEGTVSAITANLDGSVTMTVMGMTVNVPTGTPAASPSATLTLAQLVDPAPLPNRTQAGFTGGTAIIIGTVAASGVVTAEDVFVEPAENVMLGVVTANNAGALSINGVPITMLNDPRMPAKPVQDVNGIAIIPASIPVGTGASAEGYFANGVFNAFLVEAEQGTPVNVAPQVTITRALGRERTPNNRRGDEVEVRGSVTTTHAAPGVTTQTVRIFRIDGTTQTVLGTATATVDPLTPGVATFVFRVTTPATNNAILGVCPTTVRVVNISAGANNASSTSPVEVR